MQIAEQDLRQAVSDDLIRDVLRERQAERRWRLLKRSLLVVAGLVSFLLYLLSYASSLGWKWIPNNEITAVVRIDGEISAGSTASADRVVPLLRKAFEAPNVKAVVLNIDSPGGAPVEAERIYQAITSFKKKHPKPVVSVINNIGASAAYMVALHTDKIYAANYSLVGSVGAVLTGWDFHKALDKLEISQRVYASGKLKSMLNPYLPMTPEAERKAQEMVQLMGQRFKQEVQAARGKKIKGDVDYTTGEVWDGAQAKEIGLIDEIGTLDTVTDGWGVPAHDFGPKGRASGWLNGMAKAIDWLSRMDAQI